VSDPRAGGGKKDLSAGPERMKLIFDEAKDGEYVELPTGTHMMAMEMPEQVAEAMLRFRERAGCEMPEMISF
jgi:hypothetical protein